MSCLAGKKIVVTGGAGFLGTAVCEVLREHDPALIFVPRSANYDLRNRDAIRQLLADQQPEVVIHLAALIGGIGANEAEPGRYFYDNAVMGVELIEQCRRFGVEKMVLGGSVCAYPKFTPVPFREDDIWSGGPEETNAAYGFAKRLLLVQSKAYRDQYGFNTVSLLLGNMYGPRDNFDLKTSHVIPAMIRKCFEAKAAGTNAIPVWGTGKASRDFLFVRDAAEGVVAAAERYNGEAPVNLGSGSEISIRDLTEKISELTGFEGRLDFDASRPDGQLRRCLDTSRAHQLFGFQAKTSLEVGLQLTIDWYLNQSC